MKERIALWDNLKFVLITLVVVGHFADVFTNVSDTCKSIFAFIYAFHMPLFLFLNGLFYKSADILRKCLFYISAGYLLKIVSAVIIYFCGSRMSFSLLSDAGMPWYMFVFAMCTAITYLLRNQNKGYILFFSILLACVVGYDQSIGDFLYLSRLIVFFPFFYLGTMINPQKIVEFKQKYIWWLFPLAMILLVGWAYLCYAKLDDIYVLRHLFTGRNPFNLELITYGAVERLLCYAIAVFIGFALIILVPTRRIACVTSMGKNTLNVYFWHWNVYVLFNRFFGISQLFYQGILGKISFLLIGVVMTVVLSQKYVFSFPLKQIKNAIFNEGKKVLVENINGAS